MAKSKNAPYNNVMLIDDNEIDNLINQKMIEASGISNNVYIHTGAKSAIEFLPYRIFLRHHQTTIHRANNYR